MSRSLGFFAVGAVCLGALGAAITLPALVLGGGEAPPVGLALAGSGAHTVVHAQPLPRLPATRSSEARFAPFVPSLVPAAGAVSIAAPASHPATKPVAPNRPENGRAAKPRPAEPAKPQPAEPEQTISTLSEQKKHAKPKKHEHPKPARGEANKAHVDSAKGGPKEHPKSGPKPKHEGGKPPEDQGDKPPKDEGGKPQRDHEDKPPKSDGGKGSDTKGPKR